MTGWEAAHAFGHRPNLALLHLPDKRLAHILDGDQYGGGHRHGTGIPGKSEFPATWSDQTAASFIRATARAPQRVVYTAARGRRVEQWRCEREWDGVVVVSIVHGDGHVHTAWPLPGGRGVVDNPRGIEG
ncbi:MAG: hypothetical protein GEV10_01035 [Streptosporangiales bacterium]|nr:hypothetical protein [Streptosporangiales bacterium]